MQIQISWLLQKPTDLDLHCLLRQDMSCSAREGLRLCGSLECNHFSNFGEDEHYFENQATSEMSFNDFFYF